MLDRTQAPVTKPIENIHITEPRVITAPNGIEIHILDMGDQEVVRIDLMFGSGKWEQNKLLVAMFTNLLMKEGVEGMTSQEVAEHLDYYGAWLQPSATFHNSYITLYSLNKHVNKTIPVLEKIVKNPIFPQEEFDVIRNRRKQQFRVDDEKVDVKAFNRFVEGLFGKDFPYGNCASESDFDQLKRDDLTEFHQNCYTSSNCRIILTGRVTDDILDQVIAYFGKVNWGKKDRIQEPHYQKNPYPPGRYLVEKADALQSAVRIGIPLVGRLHPDYPKLRILNTLLGGYFGSRLMTNIREEKGYTYGIGSSITTLKYASYLSISTQTATEYTEPLIKEVFYEINRLREELVPVEELEMMRGYLMGEMARLFDGPFSTADAHQSLLANDMTVEYYSQMISAIQQVKGEELRELARKYFIDDQFYIVVAGQNA
ncbi:MAG: M16 family metallopeptidase [Bacteroidales bacterium]